MTSSFVQFFENVNFSSSYKGLSAHQIWFNLDQGKQSYGGGVESAPPPQVENVLNRPGEIGLKRLKRRQESGAKRFLSKSLEYPIRLKSV